MGKILNFLFGKSPDIFDENGNVRHKLPEEKWKAWERRYTADPQYNWRQHTGIKRGGRAQTDNTSS